MINVKGTIFSTLKRAFDRMRLLAENKPDLMKKILFLIVLDDIYEWSDYLNEKQSVQKRLQELRTNFILCNPEFDICRFPFNLYYININTPQTNETWSRIWDKQSEELTVLEEQIQPSCPTEKWIEDPTCRINIVYFGGNQDKIKKDSETGNPDLLVNNLTVCEKMNIYIDRTNGIFWYLDTNGSWQQMSGLNIDPEYIIQLIKDNRGKINRNWTNSSIELSIVDNDAEANSNLELLTESDLEGMI